MGIFDKIRNEFIDIIEWKDATNDTLVWQFPRYQSEIKMGAKLTVRESQVAIFLNEGTIADVFRPGMYTLETNNLPVLSTLKGWKYGFNSPFKADIYFLSTRQFTDQKWGTKNPIILDDSRFGMIEIRAFGTYTFQINDPTMFIRQISGTNSSFAAEDIAGQLRSLIINKFTDAVGEGNIPIEKFAANIEELSEIGQNKLNDVFESYGLKILRFIVENVSMPEELKKEIFEYSRLNKIDINKLTQLKAAKSIEQAATNQNSTMGAGVGMGMGFGMGNVMTNAMAQAMQPNVSQASAAVPPPLPSESSYFLALNGQQSGPFPLSQLQPMVMQGTLKRDTLAWKQGMASWIAADTIPELQSLFNSVPPPLPPM
jgi:membrane protease subunit (stomatin/prohibitin family)